jgi:hypothetical protein
VAHLFADVHMLFIKFIVYLSCIYQEKPPLHALITENEFFIFDGHGFHLFRNTFRGIIGSLSCNYKGIL